MEGGRCSTLTGWANMETLGENVSKDILGSNIQRHFWSFELFFFLALSRCIPAYEFSLFCSYAPLKCSSGPVGSYSEALSWAFPQSCCFRPALRWVLSVITFEARAPVQPFVAAHEFEKVRSRCGRDLPLPPTLQVKPSNRSQGGERVFTRYLGVMRTRTMAMRMAMACVMNMSTVAAMTTKLLWYRHTGSDRWGKSRIGQNGTALKQNGIWMWIRNDVNNCPNLLDVYSRWLPICQIPHSYVTQLVRRLKCKRLGGNFHLHTWVTHAYTHTHTHAVFKHLFVDESVCWRFIFLHALYRRNSSK